MNNLNQDLERERERERERDAFVGVIEDTDYFLWTGLPITRCNPNC